MFVIQLHRHHLSLPWPLPQPRLSQLSVKIEVENEAYLKDTDVDSQFAFFASISGRVVDNLCRLEMLYSA